MKKYRVTIYNNGTEPKVWGFSLFTKEVEAENTHDAVLRALAKYCNSCNMVPYNFVKDHLRVRSVEEIVEVPATTQYVPIFKA